MTAEDFRAALKGIVSKRKAIKRRNTEYEGVIKSIEARCSVLKNVRLDGADGEKLLKALLIDRGGITPIRIMFNRTNYITPSINGRSIEWGCDPGITIRVHLDVGGIFVDLTQKV